VADFAAPVAGIGFEPLSFTSKALTGKNKNGATTPHFSGGQRWQLKMTYT
jgi:hypothetical protein